MRARVVVLFAFVALAAGCGARVSDGQRTALGHAAGVSRAGPAEAVGQSADVAAPVALTSSTDASGAGVSTAARASGAAAAAEPSGGATDVGVTATTVRLGNISTLSGPVPGLFQGAVIGTQAAVAYQNSLGG